MKKLLILLFFVVSLQLNAQVNDSTWTVQDSIKYEHIKDKVLETMEMYRGTDNFDEIVIVLSDMIFNREQSLITDIKKEEK